MRGMRVAYRVQPGMGLDSAPVEPMFAELKRYVRFGPDDARRLAEARPEVESSFGRIAEEFYDRIREHEDAHTIFSDEAQIRRLQSSMHTWLGRVFGGTYDAEYFAKTEQIGRVHVRVGLPQRFVVSAMTLIRASLCALITSAEACGSLNKLLDIEVAIMLESYRTDALARLERASTLEAASSDDATEHAPAAIVGLDDAGSVFLWNPGAEAISGWARDEIVGRHFVDVVIAPQARAEAASSITRATDFETTLLTRSGKERQTRWRTSRPSTARGGRGATFLFGVDITDEAERRAQGEQQSRLVAAATMVAGLAHAIRNPLNGAGLHLALVERAVTKAGARDTLDAVRVAGAELRRLGSLVTDFLEFAQPQPLVAGKVDARMLCERAVTVTRSEANARHVTIKSDLPAQPLFFEADGTRVEQVLLHLVENAIDALASTGGEVVVRVRREPRHVVFEVEDTGPGLPDPTAPVFDAFYSTKPEGTGLGLAIVHRVVADHEGDIDVDSRAGSTRFRVRLPLTREGMKS